MKNRDKIQQTFNVFLDNFEDDDLHKTQLEQVIDYGMNRVHRTNKIHELVTDKIDKTLGKDDYEIMLESGELIVIQLASNYKFYMFVEWYGEMNLDSNIFNSVDECMVEYLTARCIL